MKQVEHSFLWMTGRKKNRSPNADQKLYYVNKNLTGKAASVKN